MDKIYSRRRVRLPKLSVFYKNSKNDYIYIKKYNKGKISINKQINNKFL